MKRPPKMKTPDHTRLILGQDKYYRPFIDGYIKILQSNLKQVRHFGQNYSFTTYTCRNPIIGEIPIGNPSGYSGIIVSGPAMIFLLLEISYLSASVVNCFVITRCCEMMKNASGWKWRKCLG